MTPEGRVKAKIKAYLNTLPHCWYFMPVSNGMGSMGIPDIIGCYKGQFFAIECKAPGRKSTVTALQARQIDAILAAHGRAVILDDPAETAGWMAAFDSRAA